MTPASSNFPLPSEFLVHARELASGNLVPVEPKHAATVVLLRDGASGLEAYLLRRTRSMQFAAGMYVFPGGSVDPRDTSLADDAWAGPPPAAWARLLTADEATTKALPPAAHESSRPSSEPEDGRNTTK